MSRPSESAGLSSTCKSPGSDSWSSTTIDFGHIDLLPCTFCLPVSPHWHRLLFLHGWLCQIPCTPALAQHVPWPTLTHSPFVFNSCLWFPTSRTQLLMKLSSLWAFCVILSPTFLLKIIVYHFPQACASVGSFVSVIDLDHKFLDLCYGPEAKVAESASIPTV